jgi:hypothetical protein
VGDDRPSLEQFNATRPPGPAARRTAAATPPWSPSLELDEGSGQLTTGVVEGDPDWDHIFRHWNLDPALWEVVPGSLRVNAWEGPSQDGPTIYRQYRANVVRRRRPGVEVDAELCVDGERQRLRDAHAAQDVTQAVFLALALKA